MNDPCPIGLVILPIKATKKKKKQLMEVVLFCRAFICTRVLNGSSNGAIEVLTAERLRVRRRIQRKDYEDRN
jgi:hypothetical protein